MSKRLVKAAKQQFEERRAELKYRYQYELCESEIYYAYTDEHENFFIFREQGGEYKELRYNQTYEAFVFGERFLSALTERLAEAAQPVKPLFDWYASADHDDEPFTMLDIYMCELESEHITFEDIYEEIPSDKEQWEADSEHAIEFSVSDYTAYYSEDDMGKYEICDKCLKIYLFNAPMYNCFVYPSLGVLHKDKEFIDSLKEHIREFSLDAEPWIAKVDEWASKPFGECPLPFDIPVIHYVDYTTRVRIAYAENEIREEHPKSTEEILKHVDMDPVESLKRTILRKIRVLYDQGYVLDSKKLSLCDFVACVDGSCVSLCDYDVAIYLGTNDELGIDYNSTGDWKDLKVVQRMKYPMTLGDLKHVCVEHLYAILQSMTFPV